jgi:uncharacterized protein (DUF2164 family)
MGEYLLISIKLPKEQKDMIVRDLKAFFEEERSETIGNLAAEQFIDFMIKEVGPFLYNKGIEDARQLVMEQLAFVEEELYSLQRPIRNMKMT